MTGIERLRELGGHYAGNGDPIVKMVGHELLSIADQIESGGEEYDRLQSKRWTIVWWMVREMEQHVSGVEGAEDSPVAHWARELRYALKSDTSDAAEQQSPSCADPAEAADVTSDAAKVTRDHAEDVSMSAYDLLPEAEREAIAWVREHGGIESVKEEWNRRSNLKRQLDSALAKVERKKRYIKYLQVKLSERRDKINVMRAQMVEMKRRLMPEGMEWLLDVWPKWSNGEYCKFGDWWKAEKYGKRKPQQLRRLAFFTPEQLREWGQDEGENFGYEWDFVRPSDTTYHPDKVEPPAPKVLDADGVEIEVDDDLYSVEGMLKFHVSAIDTKNARIATEAMFALDKWADPTMYTHRAPVLAADGRPLREGETVYHVADGRACVVREVREGGAVVEPVDGRPCGRCRADYLTHERPEVDSWERLEEDARLLPSDYRDRRGIADVYATEADDARAMARDIVRRAKALAERSTQSFVPWSERGQ